MSIEEAKLWLQVAHLVITAALGLYVWAVNRHRVTNQRITDLEKSVDDRLDDHAERLVGLEVQMRAAPTHKDLAQVHEKLNRVAESSSRMEGEIKHVNDTLRLILARITEKGMR